MSSFRKFGGMNFSSHNNIVKHNILNANTSSFKNSGALNSKELFLSHVDMSGNSLLNVGNIYFENGTILDGSFNIPTLEQTLSVGNSAGIYDIDMTANSLLNVNKIYFMNGTYIDASFNSNLSLNQVLSFGNSAGTCDIDLNDKSLINVNKISSGSSGNILIDNHLIMADDVLVPYAINRQISSSFFNVINAYDSNYNDAFLKSSQIYQHDSLLTFYNNADTTNNHSANYIFACNKLGQNKCVPMQYNAMSFQIDLSCNDLSLNVVKYVANNDAINNFTGITNVGHNFWGNIYLNTLGNYLQFPDGTRQTTAPIITPPNAVILLASMDISCNPTGQIVKHFQTTIESNSIYLLTGICYMRNNTSFSSLSQYAHVELYNAIYDIKTATITDLNELSDYTSHFGGTYLYTSPTTGGNVNSITYSMILLGSDFPSGSISFGMSFNGTSGQNVVIGWNTVRLIKIA